ncbi:MAG: hypothetical protein DMF56_11425 [Acidobacteria bacterium]|nr:MAG: hypothetical protein DMF56_11425 [Acidobacteriota bacterium]
MADDRWQMAVSNRHLPSAIRHPFTPSRVYKRAAQIARPASIAKTLPLARPYQFRRMLLSRPKFSHRRRPMTHAKTKWRLAAILMFVAALPVVAAPKRRSVSKPITAPFTATVKGSVVDSTTGLPVAFATIAISNLKVTTTKEGTFELNNVNGIGVNVPVVASRTGYNSDTQTIAGNGTFTLTFHLRSRPTIAVRLTNGTTVQLDDDSVKFGYLILFSGYITTTSQQFCKGDGTRVTVPITDIKKITGPSQIVTNSSCCTRLNAELQRVRVEQKSGQADDMTFKESCDGYTVDFLGHDHTTGDNVFYKFSDIAEITFP